MLVGFMAAGKTTVGALVAERLGWPFVDLDEEVAASAGCSVADLFRREGEAAFRARERAGAEAAVRRSPLVLAAGGGAFTVPETRAILQAAGRTVWLRCAEEVLLDRLALVKEGRPLAGSHERMRAMLRDREPAYATADVCVDVTTLAPEAAARAVVEAVHGAAAR